MRPWFFASDLHGSHSRYRNLFSAIEQEDPEVVLLGGDLLPLSHVARKSGEPVGDDFLGEVLGRECSRLSTKMGERYPRILVILGNDDPRTAEEALLNGEKEGLWEYIHMRVVKAGGLDVYGYSFVPPTPFRLKDWEKYDVSAYVDPGCTHPADGVHTTAVDPFVLRHSTIMQDITHLTADADLSKSIFLFHTPPHATQLDRAALDGVLIDGVPADCHVGSIAVRRFIEQRQPLFTLHGHIHESARLTGVWMEMLGSTCMISAAHDGPELALVRFHPARPGTATRELL